MAKSKSVSSKSATQPKYSRIGLEQGIQEKLVPHLQQLLANYHLFYMNTRGFHWNIRGRKFFELHVKFEELYNNLQLKIDEIAERILTLGKVPVHSFSDYIEMSEITEIKDITSGDDCVNAILESFKTVLVMQREVALMAQEAGDEGTNSQMSDYIREQEKMVWMYSSFLEEGF
jgi:starvation-inducible DNA-binding protein